MSSSPSSVPGGSETSKAHFRARASQCRRELPDKDRRSSAICTRFLSLPQYAQSRAVLVFMHIGDEVRTTDLVVQLLRSGKRTVIPYCSGEELQLYHLTDLAELSPGMLGIPEPKASFRSRAENHVVAEQLDLLAVPGLAFDRTGGRIGYGRGYFDRLLLRLRPDAVSVGLAFECQVFDRVPMQPHDVPLSAVVTENAAYWAK